MLRKTKKKVDTCKIILLEESINFFFCLFKQREEKVYLFISLSNYLNFRLGKSFSEQLCVFGVDPHCCFPASFFGKSKRSLTSVGHWTQVRIVHEFVMRGRVISFHRFIKCL